MTIRRYAVLVTATIASLSAAIEASAETGRSFLVDAGQGTAAPQDFYLWVLAGVALITGRDAAFDDPRARRPRPAWCRQYYAAE